MLAERMVEERVTFDQQTGIGPEPSVEGHFEMTICDDRI